MGRDMESWLLLAVVFSLCGYHGGIGHKGTQSHEKIRTTSDKQTHTKQGPHLSNISLRKFRKVRISDEILSSLTVTLDRFHCLVPMLLSLKKTMTDTLQQQG